MRTLGNETSQALQLIESALRAAPPASRIRTEGAPVVRVGAALIRHEEVAGIVETAVSVRGVVRLRIVQWPDGHRSVPEGAPGPWLDEVLASDVGPGAMLPESMDDLSLTLALLGLVVARGSPCRGHPRALRTALGRVAVTAEWFEAHVLVVASRSKRPRHVAALRVAHGRWGHDLGFRTSGRWTDDIADALPDPWAVHTGCYHGRKPGLPGCEDGQDGPPLFASPSFCEYNHG